METLETYHDLFIPVYIINTSSQSNDLIAIKKEFLGKKEFETIIIEADKHPIDSVGIWKSIRSIIKIALEKEDDVIIISKDDHLFTESYTKELLLNCVFEAAEYGANLLMGGVSSFGQAIPISENLFWIDSFSNGGLMIIYRSFFQRILDEIFELHDTIDGKLSELTSHKMVINPYISVRRDLLVHQFTLAALRLDMIKQARTIYAASCESPRGPLKTAMASYNKKNSG